MSLNYLLVSVLVVSLSYDLCKYETVYKKVKFVSRLQWFVKKKTFKKIFSVLFSSNPILMRNFAVGRVKNHMKTKNKK